MITLGLNRAKPNNYAFFCPVSNLHLTVTNPVGTANGITPYIQRGLKSKVLIDLSEGKDSETVKEETNNKPDDIQTPEAPVNEPVVSEPETQEPDIPVQADTDFLQEFESTTEEEKPEEDQTEEQSEQVKQRAGRRRKNS